MTYTMHTNSTVDNYFMNAAIDTGDIIKVYHFDGVKNTRIEILGKGYIEDKYEIPEGEKEICYLALKLACRKTGIELHDSGRERYLLENLWILVNKSNANILYIHGELSYNYLKDWKCGFILELFQLKNKNGRAYLINKELKKFKILNTHSNFKIDVISVYELPRPKEDWIGVGH